MLGNLLDGRYKVTQFLSVGGFGDTCIAEDTRRPGNPSCVLKRLKPASSDEFYLPNQFPEDPQTGEIIWQDQAKISPTLAAILQKMVRYNFGDRYESISAVLHDLQGLQVPLQPTQPAVPLSNDKTHQQISETTPSGIPSPAFIYKTLSVVRYIVAFRIVKYLQI